MPLFRPRYEARFDIAPDVALERARGLFDAPGTSFEGELLGRFIDIHIARAERHFWSPWLNVEVVGDDEGCTVHGRFGPHPNVWTLFLAAFALVGMLAAGALMYGASQAMAGESPWALWSLPAWVILAVLLYVASVVGQRLAGPQTELIERVLTETLRGSGGDGDDGDDGDSGHTDNAPG